MKKPHLVVLALVTSALFVVLFYQKMIGLNLLLFEAVVVPVMFYVNRPIKFNLLTVSILSATGLTAFFAVIANTSWGIFVNFALLFCLGYVLAFQKGKSFAHVVCGTFLRCFLAQISLFSPQPKDETDPNAKTSFWRKSYKFFFIVVIPVCILLFFFVLYLASSSGFYYFVEPFLNKIADWISKISFTMFWFFILGLIVANPLIMRTKPFSIYEQDCSSSNELKRIRRKYFFPFRTTALKTQNTAGVVLLFLLNALILCFNYVDITNIWIGFEWNGRFLREFVHEGTWILLFSVFISAAIALYFFHNNLNFYSKNKLLKRLTVLWIVQNLVMTLSVAIRNFHYINHFGLAYKRIAVLFFLVLVAVGLVTIIIKILQLKSSYFLWRINGFSLLVVLTVSSLFNWDTIITKYNFAHCNRSLIEYRFIAELSDAALPYAAKTMEELADIDAAQKKAMPPEIISQDYLWDYQTYYDCMIRKQTVFLKHYQSRSVLEWNLPDYLAYRKLNKTTKADK
ncbi:MAG: DUF4173 domain-containing protein [Lentimicrobiaceae bacterium]|nr:DUF4173 domain-containing protein [Lentimicrobiaceae bacterium]